MLSPVAAAAGFGGVLERLRVRRSTMTMRTSAGAAPARVVSVTGSPQCRQHAKADMAAAGWEEDTARELEAHIRENNRSVGQWVGGSASGAQGPAGGGQQSARPQATMWARPSAARQAALPPGIERPTAARQAILPPGRLRLPN